MSTVNWAPKTYPPARRSDHVDVYKSEAKGEVRVADPYNWLEDADSAETDAWTTSQEQYTRSYIDQIAERGRLEKEIRTNTDYAKVGDTHSPSVHVLISMRFSSQLQAIKTMDAGTGCITAASNHSLVHLTSFVMGHTS
jgi:hypothetical protein